MSNTSAGPFFKAFKKIGILDKPFYAQELMTPWDKIFTVDKDKLARDFLQPMEKMAHEHVNHLFVVDAQGKPTGYMSLDALLALERKKDSGEKLTDWSIFNKVQELSKVRPMQSVFDVVDIMKRTRTDAVAVVTDDDYPMGIITSSDIQTKI